MTLACGLFLGCDEPATTPTGSAGAGRAEPKVEAPARPAYTVPERTPAELAHELGAACKDARERGVRVLLEFTAPWCKDCARLQEMKADPVLSSALARTREVRINLGNFDRHTDLISAFAVRAIAHWELLEPTNCGLPPWHWRRLGQRTLEPETGKARVVPADLAAWLDARART